MLDFDFRLSYFQGPLPSLHLCGYNIPQKAVSEGPPLTTVILTCQAIEPEAHADNAQVTVQSLQVIESITHV